MAIFSVKKIREQYKKQGIFHTNNGLAMKMKSFLPDDVKEIYDPTCGSGSLLSVFGDDVKKYGQEINEEFAQYAREHLKNAEIITSDTLKEPAFKCRKFEYVIANPPFSIKWEPVPDIRFPILAPRSKADFAFIFHCLSSMNKKAVILCSHGVLYRSHSEQKCREYLIENKFIESITVIPPKSFDDTAISTVVLVLSHNNDNVKFTDEQGNTKTVPLDEIRKNDYALSVQLYVEKEELEEEKIDIKDLNKKIKEIVKREDELRTAIDKIIKEIEADGGNK